jgi:cytochrome bd-type quinol oxidase subunit 2
VWWGWRLTLALFAAGVISLFAGFAYGVIINGFPIPIQDMNRATTEQLDEFYGRPAQLATGLWFAGWTAIVASAALAVVGATRAVCHNCRA